MFDLTQDQLLSALRNLERGASHDGSTTAELAAALNYSIPRMRKMLGIALRSGVVRPCRVVREDISGRMTTTSGWRAQ